MYSTLQMTRQLCKRHVFDTFRRWLGMGFGFLNSQRGFWPFGRRRRPSPKRRQRRPGVHAPGRRRRPLAPTHPRPKDPLVPGPLSPCLPRDLIPNTAGPFAQQFPIALLPKGDARSASNYSIKIPPPCTEAVLHKYVNLSIFTFRLHGPFERNHPFKRTLRWNWMGLKLAFSSDCGW
jgi:hypothetical protein